MAFREIGYFCVFSPSNEQGQQSLEGEEDSDDEEDDDRDLFVNTNRPQVEEYDDTTESDEEDDNHWSAPCPTSLNGLRELVQSLLDCLRLNKIHSLAFPPGGTPASPAWKLF